MSFNIKAQGKLFPNKLEKWSIGAGVGAAEFYGDLVSDKLSPGFTLQLNTVVDSYHSLQAEFVMGRLTGNRLFNSNQIAGEMFDAEFMELDFNFLINISSLFDKELNFDNNRLTKKYQDRSINFMAKFGFGLNMFRTKRNELNGEQFINSYGYEWQWENNFKHAGTKHVPWNKNIVEKTLVLGFVTNYKISQKVAINFSATSRIGGNDKWDAMINQKDDMFMFYSLGTTYKITD
ncbi:MAG: hypothetical protein CBC83_09560 [Flavobacteriales bacterium TMED123]|nr:MAG: hypothetical protein CBC83_09560 [Flavobacteriales bacterium TMED123]